MSEEEGDVLGPDGQGSSRVDRDRRAPRFSWTPAYETTFFRSLCDSVHLGLRENSSFKAEAWERAAQALQDTHGAYPAKSHLINKSDNARKRFRLWRGLRENPDFSYNPLTKTVQASESAWRAHMDREPLSRALRGRPFDHEEFMEILYPDVIGSGGAPKRIMKPKRRTDGLLGDDSEMPGAGVLNLQPDSAALQPSIAESPDASRSSLSQTPSGSGTNSNADSRPSVANLPPRSKPSQPAALTPPDEPASQVKKRALPIASVEDGAESPNAGKQTSSASGDMSPQKRRRTSSHGDAVPIVTVEEVPNLNAGKQASESGRSNSRDTSKSQWREAALESFFAEFAGEDMNLQIRFAETVLTDESKALVYCKMPFRLRMHWFRSTGTTPRNS